jgi:hypothetical protein
MCYGTSIAEDTPANRDCRGRKGLEGSLGLSTLLPTVLVG